MKNFTIGISRDLKKELDQVGDELKDKLMLQQVSYDRVIRELFVHYRKTCPAPEKPTKPKSRPRPKAQPGAKKPESIGSAPIRTQTIKAREILRAA